MSASVLVVAELATDGSLKPSLRAVLGAANLLAADVDVLIAGHGVQSAAEAAQRLPHVARVLVADHADLNPPLAEQWTALLRPLARRYGHILTAASSQGKNWMPRLAALEDVAMVSDIVAIEGPDTFVRPIYAGSLWATVRCQETLKLVTVRTTAFEPVQGEREGLASIVALEIQLPDLRVKRTAVHEHAQEGRPALENARVVISGGRGLGSAEHFNALLTPLADALQGALGASRAAVDLGYAPNDLQVGQTGKVVAPELYIAVGISGAIQHLAGIQGAKIIVAINKDPEAPIFGVADYGWVGDLNELVPQLTEAIKAR